MIIDTHFHAYPRKYLELMPDISKGYVRGRGYLAGPVRAPGIQCACDTVGVDQVLFGADYPHGTGGRHDEFYPMTLEAMEELRLSKDDKDKIYYKNAKGLFGFEV